jgi:hypothetical protein
VIVRFITQEFIAKPIFANLIHAKKAGFAITVTRRTITRVNVSQRTREKIVRRKTTTVCLVLARAMEPALLDLLGPVNARLVGKESLVLRQLMNAPQVLVKIKETALIISMALLVNVCPASQVGITLIKIFILGNQ